eukprot:scaffold310720_cov36-Tisochrysis_lutea.AAC.4
MTPALPPRELRTPFGSGLLPSPSRRRTGHGVNDCVLGADGGDGLEEGDTHMVMVRGIEEELNLAGLNVSLRGKAGSMGKER